MDYEINNDYELIYLIQEEDEQALNIMLKKYEPLIKKIVNHYYRIFKDFNIDFQDLVQEGRIGLYRAIKSYKEDKNILFYTFAFMCIKGQILAIYKKSLRDKNKSSTLASLHDDLAFFEETGYIDSPEKLMEESLITRQIIEFKNNLEFIDANIFELRYNSFNYKEISKLLDISINVVDNKLVKIKKKLRKFLLEI